MEKPDRLHQIAYWAMALLCIPAVLIGGNIVLAMLFDPRQMGDPRAAVATGLSLFLALVTIFFWDILGRFYRSPEKHRSQKWTVFAWICGVVAMLIYVGIFLVGSLIMWGVFMHESYGSNLGALGEMLWVFAGVAVPVVIGFLIGCLGLVAVFRVIMSNRARQQAV